MGRGSGDCLVTLGAAQNADYDESFFFTEDAGGPYIFAGYEGRAERFWKVNARQWTLLLGEKQDCYVNSLGNLL